MILLGHRPCSRLWLPSLLSLLCPAPPEKGAAELPSGPSTLPLTGLSNPELIRALPHLTPFEMFTSKVLGLALKGFASWPQACPALPQTPYAGYSSLPPCCNLSEYPLPNPQAGEPRLFKHKREPHPLHGASLLRVPPPLVQSSQVVFCTQYNN